MTAQTRAEKDGPRSKRGVILQAAIDRFGRDGFEHTKWATIADEVGIGQTALYHYFESKAHCLLTIMNLELAASLQRFREATAGVDDHAERLRAAVASAYDVTPSEALAARILLSHMDLLITPRPSEREEAERQQARVLVRAIEDEWSDAARAGHGREVRSHDATRVSPARPSCRSSSACGVGTARAANRPLSTISEFMTGACERLVGP